MLKRISFCIILFLLFNQIGCVETNYILQDETPPILEGFYGFRWTTPMSVVDSEFPKRTSATSKDSLNRYNTSNFSDAYFLGELTSLCQFTFNQTGLTSVKILFTTNYFNYEDKLFLLKDSLSKIYGEPREIPGIVEHNTPPTYFLIYFWNERRLEITLRLDYSLEINAYSYSPLHGPIFRTK